MLSTARIAPLLLIVGCFSGCQWYVDDADREVYRLIEKRQLQALGERQDAHLGSEKVPIEVPDDAYAFVPHPSDPTIPAEFVTTRPAATAPATQPGPMERVPTTAPADLISITEDKPRRILTLSEALAYAFRHSREFQTAKEDLYLAALALSLERFLWTPQFTGRIGAEYANYGKIRDFDQAMAAVAQVGVEQRLPLGGVVTAQVINELMRDLTHHVTSGETGTAILSANIPLLRGAGLVAYESRFQAERNLIYAVRDFENFRRNLAVEIAGDFFNLQRLRQSIINARESTESFRLLARRARALFEAGRLIPLEVQRAEQEVANKENQEVDAIEQYNSALDQFKLRIGMPTEEPIDVPLPDETLATQPADELSDNEAVALEEALTIPEVSPEAAIATALRYRLDLLNQRDLIDDAARGVRIAENNMLPDLNASGSVTWNTDPAQLGSFKYEDDRVTWRAGVNLELPLNRQAERNALRSALIFKRRAERNYELFRDQVILQVRRAMRRVEQQRRSLEIQVYARDLAIQRNRMSRILFERAEVSNREVVDAENELLNARNRLALARSQLHLAILQFRRDTGTLRVDDDGKWTRPVMLTGGSVATTQPNG